MFNKSKPKSRLEIQIEESILSLNDHSPDSDEYGEIVERLSKLHKINQDIRPASVDPNTALAVAANLVGIFAIIKHESINVISSKALNFVFRPR